MGVTPKFAETAITVQVEKKRKYEESMAERSPNQSSKINLMDELEDALECPVCLKAITDPPIYVCENIHSLCHQCRESLIEKKSPCLLCGGRLTDKRCHLVEKIVQKLPKISCKFEGCTFQRTSQELILQHEQKCPLRPIACAYCDITTSLNAYIEHMTSNHSSNIISHTFPGFDIAIEIQVSTSFTVYGQMIIKVENDSQLPNFRFDWIDNFRVSSFFFWISCVGPNNAADEYKFTLQVYNGQAFKKGKIDFLFEGVRRCVPCDISHAEMKARKQCLMVDSTLIEEATKGNDDCLSLRLMIHRA